MMKRGPILPLSHRQGGCQWQINPAMPMTCQSRGDASHRHIDANGIGKAHWHGMGASTKTPMPAPIHKSRVERGYHG